MSKKDTVVINLRTVPVEIHTHLKQQAVKERMSLENYITTLLTLSMLEDTVDALSVTIKEYFAKAKQ